MNREEITNSQDYKATKIALDWWYSLPEEQRKATDIDAEPDIVDAYSDGVIYGWNNPNWISVEDELPEHNEEDNGLISYPTVLVCLYDGFRTEDYYDDISGEWRDFDGDVEYWMPMPQPPRKEDKI